MEAINAHRVNIVAQAGHGAIPTSIDIIPQDGYDGQAAHDEAEEIFAALRGSLPGYTYTRVLARMLSTEAELMDETDEYRLARVYRNAYFAITGDKAAAEADQATLEEFYETDGR